MHPVIEAQLQQFIQNFELDGMSQPDAFERMCAFSYLSKENIRGGDFRDTITGPGEEGIDSIAVIANGTLMQDPDDVDVALNHASHLRVRYIFIQSKASDGWGNGGAIKFARAVKGFFNGTDIGSDSWTETCRDIHARILENSAHLEDLPTLKAYYIAGTPLPPADQEFAPRKHMAELTDELESLALFSRIESEPIGAKELQKRYRLATTSAKATINFENKVKLTGIAGIEQAYLGVLPAEELVRLVMEGDLDNTLHKESRLEPKPGIMDDNVRAFQGDEVPVNQSIAATLRGEENQKFALLNNGVTIIAREMQNFQDAFTLTDFQIVNGGQTSTVILHNWLSLSNQDFRVPVKLIQTRDEALINDIVSANNNQTPVEANQLHSRATLEKDIETYFSNDKLPGQLFYERRSKQYADKPEVPDARVISRTALIRSVAATFQGEPHLATGYTGTLYERLTLPVKHNENTDRPASERTVMSADDEVTVYYSAASASYRLDLMLKTGRIDPRFKPARWHILNVARIIAIGNRVPRFNDRKITKWVDPFTKMVWDDKLGLDLFIRAAEIVDSSGLTLDRKPLKTSEATVRLTKLAEKKSKQQ